MKTRTVRFKLSLDNTHIDEEFTFNKGITDDEIEDAFLEWRNEHLHSGWEEDNNWTSVD